MMAFVLTAAILTQSATSPAPLQPGVVTGQLTMRDGTPAAGMRVGAMTVPASGQPVSSSSTIVGLTQTDSAGRYRIENVPAGRYYVIAGFVESPAYFPGVTSLNTATAINVTSANTVRGVDFVMVGGLGVTVKGRVIRPASHPTTGPARIQLSGGPVALPDTAVNSDGTFEFQRVRPGPYNILVSSGTLARPVSVVVADKDINDVNVVLVTTVQLSGSLVIEGGGPIPRFTLSFLPFSGGTAQSGVSIQNNGSFTLQIPEGEYRVGWNNLPAGYVLKSITSGPTNMLTDRLNVVGGSPIAPLVVTLEVFLVKVSGKVTGSPNFSNEGPIRLRLIGTTTGERFEVLVNSDGSFEFAKVLPGSYIATITTPSIPFPNTTVLVTDKDTNVEIVLAPMKNVTGRVTLEGPGLMPRLTFTLPAPVSGGFTSSVDAVSQPDGSFKVYMPEGERRITLNVPGYTVKSLTYGSTDLLRDPIKLSAADTTEIRVVLAAASVSNNPAQR